MSDDIERDMVNAGTNLPWGKSREPEWKVCQDQVSAVEALCLEAIAISTKTILATKWEQLESENKNDTEVKLSTEYPPRA